MNNGKNTSAARALAMGVMAALVIVGMAGTGAAVSGLVAEWHFDGNAQDSSGNGNHGTISGATFVSGISGQALSFDGVDDYVSIPNMSNTPELTIETWINVRGGAGVFRGIFGQGGGSGLWSPSKVHFQVSHSNEIEFAIYNGGHVESTTLVGLSSNYNKWFHIVAVYDKDPLQMKVYVNGVDESSVMTSPSAIDVMLTDLRIGSTNDGRYFNGLIDEVRIYNRALTASEIQANYNAILNPAPTIGTITVTTNLAGATFTLTGASSYSGTGTSWNTTSAPAGTYTITYGTVTGYNTPPSETKTLSAGGSITFSGTYATQQQLATTGNISVSSTPSGASIYLDDGTYKGKTALTIYDVTPGSHRIELKLDGYKPADTIVEVRAGSTSYVSVPLLEATATITPTYTSTLPPRRLSSPASACTVKKLMSCSVRIFCSNSRQ